MAVGRNRNKITACALGTFFFTVWMMVFTAPYLYTDANLGPMVGFVYAGMSLITLAYSWFCVGETTGRTNAELERFFSDRIPVRQWESHVWADDFGSKIEAEKAGEGRVESVVEMTKTEREV
jgi:hypothetical protein